MVQDFSHQQYDCYVDCGSIHASLVVVTSLDLSSFFLHRCDGPGFPELHDKNSIVENAKQESVRWGGSGSFPVSVCRNKHRPAEKPGGFVRETAGPP